MRRKRMLGIILLTVAIVALGASPVFATASCGHIMKWGFQKVPI